jgi:hypothetical protein
LFSSVVAMAATECNIDTTKSVTPDTNLISVVSGNVAGFSPGPVYVTVTSDGKEYTTTSDKNGKFAMVYANTSGSADVLCWQGWPGDKQLEARAHIANE